jgi:hypothetical protein
MDFNDKDFEDVTPYVEKIATEDLDSALAAVKLSQAEYDAAKEVSNEKHAKMEMDKEHLIALMKRANKSRWEVAEIGGFSLIDTLKFKVPDSLEGKGEFFKFLKSPTAQELLGQDAATIFLTYATVNYNTLNSLCKTLKETAADKGLDLQIPGLAQPIAESNLRALPRRN